MHSPQNVLHDTHVDRLLLLTCNGSTAHSYQSLQKYDPKIQDILNTIIKNDPKTNEDVLALETSEGTINDLIIAKTSKIGEKLSFRRFNKVTKKDSE